MICPNCGKRVNVADKYMRSLESYNPGGSLLVTTSCCKTISYIRMYVTFKLEPYTGDEKVDNFGVKSN